MEINEIKKIIEALLFVSDRPLLTREIKNVLKDSLSENDNIENILVEMQKEYNDFLDRAFELNSLPTAGPLQQSRNILRG